MALLKFKRGGETPRIAPAQLGGFLDGFSIEVMPRTAAKVEDFRALLPEGTRVYIAHIAGTPIEEMTATAARLAADGFRVMPHFPARIISGPAQLAEWIGRYQDAAGVTEALVLAGGVSEPVGSFDSSMQMLETGLFEKAGFTRLHVAGHPEGSRDIDPDGSMTVTTEAVRWKNDYARQSSAEMALVTQFAFEAAPVIAWAEDLAAQGITLPVHVGLAGPAKLQTLIKFAVACGVGPSLKVLQKRAMDVSKLLLPYEPTAVAADLASYTAANPGSLIAAAHMFPLGGIAATAGWTAEHGRAPAAAISV